ncbi:MAG: hypothetical protein LBP30_01500 [Clostridiales Family XIII bacterium]|jgi:hypothetical protein|nr:hypothetical protein [Clostridiales Family XIII bacterium]
MKSQLRLNYNSAKLRVCVDRVDGGAIGGRVFGLRLKDVLFFTDLNGLALSLDRLMDEQNYPQAFQRKRTFKTASPSKKKRDRDENAAEDREDRPYMDEETVESAFGERMTFVLHVLSRQNTNWQGYVEFPDGAGKREFESELGFLALVNEALSN